MSIGPRGRETWTLVPTFAGRRMAAGQPISLLHVAEYDERSGAIDAMYRSTDAVEAARLAREQRVDYVFVDAVERARLRTRRDRQIQRSRGSSRRCSSRARPRCSRYADRTEPGHRSMQAVTIVGAGVAGLTIAYQLARQGYRDHRHREERRRRRARPGRSTTATSISTSARIGSTPRTARVADFIRDILGKDAIEIPRKSGARMFGRFHEWPLRPSILLSMPITLMIARRARPALQGAAPRRIVRGRHRQQIRPHAVRDLLRAVHAEVPVPLARRAASRLGPGRRQPRGDRQAGGIGQPVEPAQEHAACRSRSRRCSSIRRTGVGRFSDVLADSITSMGGRVVLGQAVDRASRRDGSRVTAVDARSGERIPCDNIVWTGAADDAECACSAIEGVDLEYLSTIFYNLEIGKPPRLDYQWTYFGGDEIFSRVTAPEAFLPATTPPGKSGLCVEVTCREGDERWQNPERYTQPIIADLVRTGAIERAAGRRTGAHRARAVHLSDLQAELPRRADPQPEGARPRTRTCCSPDAAAGSGTTTWTTRSARG